MLHSARGQVRPTVPAHIARSKVLRRRGAGIGGLFDSRQPLSADTDSPERHAVALFRCHARCCFGQLYRPGVGFDCLRIGGKFGKARPRNQRGALATDLDRHPGFDRFGAVADFASKFRQLIAQSLDTAAFSHSVI